MSEKVLQEILSIMRRFDEKDDGLWALEDIAHYIKASLSTARNLTNAPNFPRPIRLPTSENGGQPRWYIGEVKAYCRRFKSF